MQALDILRDEHASIASMLQGLADLVHGIRDFRMPPNFGLLRAMLYYIQSYPERLHHPKEERWVFLLLALRHPPARPLLDRLRDEHREGSAQLAALQERLQRYEQEGAAAFGAFAAAVDAFVACERDHIGREERDVVPLAREHLTARDWEEIDAAFAGHADPLHGVPTGDGFAELHRRLMRLPDAAPGEPALGA